MTFPKEIVFPVICITDSRHLRIKRSLDSLTDTTTAGVRNGMFDKLTIIGLNGWSVRITAAQNLGGIGPFFGYNIFLNRRIRVELETSGEPKQISFDEVKVRALKCTGRWMNSMVGGSEWRQQSEAAGTMADLVELLDDPVRAMKDRNMGSEKQGGAR